MPVPPVPPRTWVRFCVETGVTPPPNTQVDRYRVEAVRTLRGAPLTGVAPGTSLLRLESTHELPAGDGDIIGVTQELLYTRAAERAALATTAPPGPDALCVLIPITKSEAWWQLALDERDALFRGGGTRAGHVALGLPLARTLLRKLYHGRPFSGAGWDLLAYLECAPAERQQLEALLAGLRDPEQNPEWNHVERETEIWLKRDEASGSPRA
jgi:hypothetical protein